MKQIIFIAILLTCAFGACKRTSTIRHNHRKNGKNQSITPLERQ